MNVAFRLRLTHTDPRNSNGNRTWRNHCAWQRAAHPQAQPADGAADAASDHRHAVRAVADDRSAKRTADPSAPSAHDNLPLGGTSEDRDSLTSAFSMLAARVALLEHRLERLRWHGPVLALVSAGLLIYALWRSLS
jgi:hypothetical protein